MTTGRRRRCSKFWHTHSGSTTAGHEARAGRWASAVLRRRRRSTRGGRRSSSLGSRRPGNWIPSLSEAGCCRPLACMRMQGSRVAVVGAGPGGLVAAKYAIEAGFDVTVFEASDGLGGQWHTTAGHSGVWPGMHTNTSRAMTAFSDFPAPADYPLHPAAEQVDAYLHAYARKFGVIDRIRFRLTRLRACEWDGRSTANHLTAWPSRPAGFASRRFPVRCDSSRANCFTP